LHEDTRYNIDPKEHIRNLFKNTKDGKVDITIYPITGDEPFDITYNVDWSEADAQAMVLKSKIVTSDVGK
jgi:hypothetical protein